MKESWEYTAEIGNRSPAGKTSVEGRELLPGHTCWLQTLTGSIQYFPEVSGTSKELQSVCEHAS